MGKNLFLKIFALAIAVFLWAQQELMKEQTIHFRVPVKLRDIPQDMILVGMNQDEIQIEIEGKGYDLFKLKVQQFFQGNNTSLQASEGNNAYISIDAQRFSEGSNTVRVTREDLYVPVKMRKEMRSDKMQFDFEEWLEIRLDKVITVKKPVELIFASADDRAYFNEKNMIINISRVDVKGPQKLLKSVDRISTEPISKRMVKDYIATVSLVSPDPSVKLLADKIKIDISTAQYVTVTIPLIPIFNPRSSEFEIMPQKVSALVRGRKDMLDEMDGEELNPFVNLEGVKTGDELKIEFNPPADVKIIEFTPERIQVRKIETD